MRRPLKRFEGCSIKAWRVLLTPLHNFYGLCSIYPETKFFQVEMASTIPIPPPSHLLCLKKPIFRTLPKYPIFNVRERGRLVGIVAKAVGENPDSSTSIVKYVQKAWDKSEDRLALAGLGFAGLVAVWASSNLIMAIDKLPIVPTVFEFIGLLFSWWFIYRYLLFKPDREELLKIIKSTVADVLGQ